MKLTKKGRKLRDQIVMVLIALLILAHLHIFILVIAIASLVIGIYVGRQHSAATVKTIVKKTSRKVP